MKKNKKNRKDSKVTDNKLDRARTPGMNELG